MGCITTYTEKLSNEICSLVANGSNLNRICQQDGMPHRDSVYEWFKVHPDFFERYSYSRECRADWRADKIDDVIVDMRTGIIDSNMARVEIDAIKWQAGREKPKVYGDKTSTEITGKDGKDLVPKTDPTDLARRIAFLLAQGLANSVKPE